MAKIESLALLGADVFTLHTTRSKANTDGTGGRHASPVTHPKYRLPENGASPGNDEYGRPHIFPEWVVKSKNQVFLEALWLRMSLVDVSFNFHLVDLKTHLAPSAPQSKTRILIGSCKLLHHTSAH